MPDAHRDQERGGGVVRAKPRALDADGLVGTGGRRRRRLPGVRVREREATCLLYTSDAADE